MPVLHALCRTRTALACSLLALLPLGGATLAAEPAAPAGSTLDAADAPARCAALREARYAAAGLPGLEVTDAQWRPEGTPHTVPGFGGPPQTRKLPAHCEVLASSAERTGADGQRYAIHLRLRLPLAWNGRFLFQGGGGSNGVVGDALSGSGLDQGYAVLAQDSGHDNARNNDPQRNQELVFGFDPQARADYGHASLKPTAEAGLAWVERFYGRAAKHRYFSGCSKGGQEGMAFAQRYPEVFDGIVAAAPGFALPKAALAEMWDTQQFGRLVADPATGRVELGKLSTAFTGPQLKAVRAAILEACDADDGLADGIVGDTRRCTPAKVRARLVPRTCPSGGSGADCLSPAQIQALEAVLQGPRNKAGQALYSTWFWPSGIDDGGWRIWKIGGEGGMPPALNVLLGSRAMASAFSSPPVALPPGPQAGLDYAMAFDFERDAPAVHAVVAPFTRSAWQDVGMRDPNLSAFQRRGGKLIVPHGESDPVFSLADTIAWFDEANVLAKGRAAEFVRVFPVPGMAHCGGGPATDEYDALAAVVRWVEQGQAPDRIEARAGSRSPWPGRTRPLCPHPLVARYVGKGDPERSESFACKP
ncbi:tannase/feruloyl esterase family alpha/beta hydrolase [Roseateles paludis]|uniref:Tannase/feruloyl esterase family alpha/beta hydrolase n=1 Tax=Roseateles paludis TaxID=3145238 RepID=A0ABV0FX89_9BURK